MQKLSASTEKLGFRKEWEETWPLWCLPASRTNLFNFLIMKIFSIYLASFGFRYSLAFDSTFMCLTLSSLLLTKKNLKGQNRYIKQSVHCLFILWFVNLIRYHIWLTNYFQRIAVSDRHGLICAVIVSHLQFKKLWTEKFTKCVVQQQITYFIFTKHAKMMLGQNIFCICNEKMVW